METDHQFYELFRVKPAWFESLTGIKLPPGCVGKSITHKKIETRSDLVFEPARECDAHFIVEFQLYFDHSVFERIGMARHALWRELNATADCRRKDYKVKSVNGVVIFGRKSHVPSCAKTRHSAIEYQMLGELLDSLTKRNPDSILLDVLAPVVEPAKVLEKSADRHYHEIINHPGVSMDERKVAEDIFFSFLIQRFRNKSLKQLREMIAELTPLDETRFAKDCFQKGIEKRTREFVQRMREAGLSVKRISEITKLSEKSVRGYLEADEE